MIGKNERMVRAAQTIEKIPGPSQEQTGITIVPVEQVAIQIERA
jgi:hypothetical protein